MSGTGYDSPVAILNQQGVYPLSPLPELSVSPASTLVVTPQQDPSVDPPSLPPHLSARSPSPSQELRGGTPLGWESPPLNQQGCNTFMSPLAVSSVINAYSDALVAPKACYPRAHKKARVVVGSGLGFRPVSRRLVALAPVEEEDCAMQDTAVSDRYIDCMMAAAVVSGL